MSKELTPLEALEYFRTEVVDSYDGMFRYEIIETALKEYKELKQDYEMLKEEYFLLDKDYEKVIKPKLKALEIIKEKRVDIYHIQSTNKVDKYNFWKQITSKSLKKKEYELLKEVLL